jgi:hypothetical protein
MLADVLFIGSVVPPALLMMPAMMVLDADN